MLHRMLGFEVLSGVGFGTILCASMLVPAPASRAQEPGNDEEPKPRVERPAEKSREGTRSESRGEDTEARNGRRRATRPESAPDPVHTHVLAETKAQVELLEAQLEVKRAHLKLAEARLKQSQDELAILKRNPDKDDEEREEIAVLETEIPVLEAERDLQRAELLEPQVHLKHAKRHVEQVEKGGPLAGGGGFQGQWGRNGLGLWGGMGVNHPALQQIMRDQLSAAEAGAAKALNDPAVHPLMRGFAPMAEVDKKLDQIREAIESLEDQVERLKPAPGK